MSSARWLLVDDDADLAFIVRLLLKRRGEALLHASSTSEAEAILAQQQAQANASEDASGLIILLDVNLPGKSGLDWLREGKRPCPVAMFVQGHMTEDLVTAWNSGANYWVPKEYVTQSERWNERLNELLLFSNGQAFPTLIDSTNPSSLAQWWDATRDAIGHAIDSSLVASAFLRARKEAVGGEQQELFTSWIVERGRGYSGLPAPLVSTEVGEAYLRQICCLFGLNVAHRLLVALELRRPPR